MGSACFKYASISVLTEVEYDWLVVLVDMLNVTMDLLGNNPALKFDLEGARMMELPLMWVRAPSIGESVDDEVVETEANY